MGALFEWLGLTVGCIQNGMDPGSRREMYSRNITYGTASEFGFDYLRDNGMATCKEDQVQNDHYFCIIDEADSILVDEARTPLIISGPMREDTPLPFMEMKPLVVKLFDTQIRECNNLAAEAKKALAEEGISDDDTDKAIAKLYQVKRGMPTNKQFLRMMEDGPIRKKFENVWGTSLDPNRGLTVVEIMDAIHADQIYGIGILAEAPQPVVVSNKLRNVPEKGLWAWDPGAHFGIHRMDEFFLVGGGAD